MVKIQNGKLIAEITPINNNPLETLGSIQNGLHDLALCVGSSSAPERVKEQAIYQLHYLLQTFQLNDLQYGEIEEAISKTPGLHHVFTLK